MIVLALAVEALTSRSPAPSSAIRRNVFIVGFSSKLVSKRVASGWWPNRSRKRKDERAALGRGRKKSRVPATFVALLGYHPLAARGGSEAKMARSDVTFYRWTDMPKERVNASLDRRLVTGERMMLAHVYLKKGCIVPRHRHENEQITYILEGALHFWIGEDESQEITVRAGEVLHIPSNVWHKAEALEDTLDVDVFDPPRQDWLEKTDAYLRK